MYATASFGFTQGDNGWLMSEFAFMRGLFLIGIFPPVISWGRKWFQSRGSGKDIKEPEPENPATAIPTSPQQLDVPTVSQIEGEPVTLESAHDRESCAFDLFFLRWSLFVDGALTTIAAFATTKWHIYLGRVQSIGLWFLKRHY